MQYTSDSLKTPDGAALFTQTWLPERGAARGVIVLVHGLGEHSGRYAHVAEFFTNAGYIVTALDHRGHGRSQGKQLGYFERFQALVDDLHLFIKNLPSASRSLPLYLIGHSMGGLLSLCYVIRYAPVINGLITSSAALDIGDNVPALARGLIRQLSAVAPTMGLTTIDSSTISRDTQVVKAYDADPYVYRGKVQARVAMELRDACTFARQNLPKVNRPILVQHGSADTLVSPTCAEEIFTGVSSKDKSLKVYEGWYHELFNEPDRQTVFQHMRDWLAAR